MTDRFAHYPSLADRVVFVTGGGSGIGASVVEHFCAQHANVAFVDIDEPASTALCARIGKTGSRPPRFIRLRPARRRRAAGDRPARGRGDRPRHGAGQQRRQRRPAQGGGRHAGILGRPHRGQPAPPVLRRAGRLSADEGGRWRIDRQFRLDQLDERRGQLQRLHDVEGGGARHDTGPRAGLGRGPHPRQHRGAGLGHDGAADQAVAGCGRRAADLREPVPQGQALSAGHRADGAVARRRRQPDVHGAELSSSTPAGPDRRASQRPVPRCRGPSSSARSRNGRDGALSASGTTA